MEAEHVKPHRSKKEIQQLSLFEEFITEGNEKAYDPATEGAMLDGGVVAADQSQHSPAEKKGGLRRAAVKSAAHQNGNTANGRSGYMDPATICPIPATLGGGKGSLVLPHGPGHAVPGIVRC